MKQQKSKPKQAIEAEVSSNPDDAHARQALGQRIGELADLFSSRDEALKTAQVSRMQLHRYISQTGQVPLEPIARLAQAKDIRLDWIWSGEGPKYNSDDGNRELLKKAIMAGLGLRALSTKNPEILPLSDKQVAELSVGIYQLAQKLGHVPDDKSLFMLIGPILGLSAPTIRPSDRKSL